MSILITGQMQMENEVDRLREERSENERGDGYE